MGRNGRGKNKREEAEKKKNRAPEKNQQRVSKHGQKGGAGNVERTWVLCLRRGGRV